MSRFAIADTLHAPAVPVPRQPRVELVRRAELVVHFPGKPRAVGPGQTGSVKILLRADGLQKPGLVRLRIGLEGQKVLRRRVEQAKGNLVVRKLRSHPGAVDELGAEGIVDRKTDTAKAEVSVQHVGAGHIRRGAARRPFVLPLPAAEDKCLVPSIVDLRDNDRPAHRDADVLVVEGWLRRRGEIRTVDQQLGSVTVFRLAMELVGSALRHCDHHAAAHASVLRRHAGGQHPHLLHCVGRSDQNLVIPRRGPLYGRLRAHPVQRVGQGPIALADGVE